ncbi:MAG: HlyD family efflux transporter periplasmic adaptor subunit [Chitinophagaceae bacterium]
MKQAKRLSTKPATTRLFTARFEAVLLCIFSTTLSLLITSCHDAPSGTNTPASVRTPVTVTSVSHFPLNEYIELNAISTYIQQNFVKSNLNGYIQKSNIKFGDHVHQGEVLFVLKTKEASAIGNAVNQLDPSFNFSGANIIRAGATGYVMQLNHLKSDYVQDGEQLAVISDSKSFAFVMNVPYEDKPFVSIGKHVQVILPDSVVMDGTISSSLPLVDSVTQTQSYSIKVSAGYTIPKDLIAKVKILKRSANEAETLPKSSILSDVTQTKYWVMKMINDSMAVKVLVKTGIEKGDTVQIVSPHFSPDAKILSGGNYGLSDTALVTTSADSSTGGN